MRCLWLYDVIKMASEIYLKQYECHNQMAPVWYCFRNAKRYGNHFHSNRIGSNRNIFDEIKVDLNGTNNWIITIAKLAGKILPTFPFISDGVCWTLSYKWDALLWVHCSNQWKTLVHQSFTVFTMVSMWLITIHTTDLFTYWPLGD